MPQSARALYGRACSLDRLAEVERSNSRLEQAIATYRSVIDMADEHPDQVPLPLLRLAAEKCIERMRFRGLLETVVVDPLLIFSVTLLLILIRFL